MTAIGIVMVLCGDAVCMWCCMHAGWVGGQCGGSGQRISLQHTRAMIDAIHSGQLQAAAYVDTPHFNLQVCPAAVLSHGAGRLGNAVATYLGSSVSRLAPGIIWFRQDLA